MNKKSFLQQLPATERRALLAKLKDENSMPPLPRCSTATQRLSQAGGAAAAAADGLADKCNSCAAMRAQLRSACLQLQKRGTQQADLQAQVDQLEAGVMHEESLRKQLEQQLQVSQSHVSNLQHDVKQLQAAATTATAGQGQLHNLILAAQRQRDEAQDACRKLEDRAKHLQQQVVASLDAAAVREGGPSSLQIEGDLIPHDCMLLPQAASSAPQKPPTKMQAALAQVSSLKSQRDRLQVQVRQLTNRLDTMAADNRNTAHSRGLQAGALKKGAASQQLQLLGALRRLQQLAAELKQRDAALKEKDDYIFKLEYRLLQTPAAAKQRRRMQQPAATGPPSPASRTLALLPKRTAQPVPSEPCTEPAPEPAGKYNLHVGSPMQASTSASPAARAASANGRPGATPHTGRVPTAASMPAVHFPSPYGSSPCTAITSHPAATTESEAREHQRAPCSTSPAPSHTLPAVPAASDSALPKDRALSLTATAHPTSPPAAPAVTTSPSCLEPPSAAAAEPLGLCPTGSHLPAAAASRSPEPSSSTADLWAELAAFDTFHSQLAELDNQLQAFKLAAASQPQHSPCSAPSVAQEEPHAAGATQQSACSASRQLPWHGCDGGHCSSQQGSMHLEEIACQQEAAHHEPQQSGSLRVIHQPHDCWHEQQPEHSQAAAGGMPAGVLHHRWQEPVAGPRAAHQRLEANCQSSPPPMPHLNLPPPPSTRGPAPRATPSTTAACHPANAPTWLPASCSSSSSSSFSTSPSSSDLPMVGCTSTAALNPAIFDSLDPFPTPGFTSDHRPPRTPVSASSHAAPQVPHSRSSIQFSTPPHMSTAGSSASPQVSILREPLAALARVAATANMGSPGGSSNASPQGCSFMGKDLRCVAESWQLHYGQPDLQHNG